MNAETTINVSAITAHFTSLLSPNCDEAKAATATMRWLAKADPVAFDAINELAEGCTFNVRRYGQSSYCEPHHAEIDIRCDPWPAARYPKSLLCVDIAHSLTAAVRA